MSHMVIYRSADGKAAFQQVDDLNAAVAFVEKIRNEAGVENSRIYRMELVNYRFEPYYQVRLDSGEVLGGPPGRVSTPSPPAGGAPYGSAGAGGSPGTGGSPSVGTTTGTGVPTGSIGSAVSSSVGSATPGLGTSATGSTDPMGGSSGPGSTSTGDAGAGSVPPAAGAPAAGDAASSSSSSSSSPSASPSATVVDPAEDLPGRSRTDDGPTGGGNGTRRGLFGR